jgi:hypothetical protein
MGVAAAAETPITTEGGEEGEDMSEAISTGAELPQVRASTEKARGTLFVAMGVVLLAILLAGFAPTFFLRAFFNVPAMRPFLYLHGTLMSAWFVVFLVQASLARTGSVAVHRKLGVAGAVVGVGALATAIIATWNALANGNIGTRIFWGNTGAFLAFAAFLALALYYRKRPYVHRRMMLFASISFIGPALGRMAGWPIASGIDLALFNNTGILLLVLGVLGHELIVDRRVHLLTAGSVVALFTVRILFTVVIPASAAGISFASSLVPG